MWLLLEGIRNGSYGVELYMFVIITGASHMIILDDECVVYMTLSAGLAWLSISDQLSVVCSTFG